VVHYPKGTVLFVQGSSRIGYLYILQKGSAERYFETGNRRSLKELLEEGDIYGGISMLLNDGISVRTVRTLEDCYFYLMPKAMFFDLCRRYESFTEFFTDAFGKRMLEKSYAAIVAKTMAPKEESLQFFNHHVATIYTSEPVFAGDGTSIQEAARTMANRNISSMFVKADSGDCIGVLTERDLARRVTAKGYDIRRPVSDIMSTPVRSIPEYALIFEALMAMMENDIRHLAVTDVDDNVVGILTNRDLLSAQGQSPLFLIRRIARAATIEQVIEGHNSLPQQVRTLITGGAKAKNVAYFITTVSDAILHKIMAFTREQLGEPPARFVFMIMGSEGRGEQTLKTDQDNAIVFEDVPAEREAEVRDYFLKYGETACNLLDQAGYAFCTGGVMAKNPKWCQSLSTWKAYFNDWIYAAEAEDLLQASIFFDFRRGYGDEGLVEDLRRYLFETLEGWAGFFRHLAENALYFKPPIGFFRNFVVESKGEHRDKFDIKSAMTPIVDFARLLALRHQIEETNTLERLSHLRIKEVLSQREYEEVEKAYSFLLQLRFVRQITAIVDERRKPDNYINPKDLTRIEQKMLKEIFIRIEKLQGKLESDFIGII
jgi:CBS domain-containing protein